MVKNTMKPMIKCANCGRMVPANPRIKNQNYCNRKACQRVRKNKWKQSKIASDPDYKNDTGIAINSGLNGIQDIIEIIENRTRIIGHRQGDAHVIMRFLFLILCGDRRHMQIWNVLNL